MNQLIILSGPPGAGKTSVATAICERFDRMIHIRVEQIRQWVCAGYRHSSANDPQALEQFSLARRNASVIARESLSARYAVVIDDVVFGSDFVEYRKILSDVGSIVQGVTLLPTLDIVRERNARRSEVVDLSLTDDLHAQFMAEAAAGELPGAILDSSEDVDAYVTVDRVQELVACGEALLMHTEGGN